MDNPTEPPSFPAPSLPPRHGCLTAWLVFMIIANAAAAIMTPLSAAGMKQAGLQPSPVILGIVVIGALANIAFAIALFRWRKWGFYGLVATSIIALVTNLSLGLGIGRSVFGLAGIALLYWLLNMGGERKAWPHLK